jgi:dimethylhistidine N-methyltransferase
MKDPAYISKRDRDVESAQSTSAMSTFAHDLREGLMRTPHFVPPKHFYDTAGSFLFDRICELPEYYPTRTELGIMTEHAPAMAELIGVNAELIEFGAGSLTKVRLLFDALGTSRPLKRYLPIDISGEHLESAAKQLRAEYPHMLVRPIVADYSTLLDLPIVQPWTRQRVGFFPGSTIGNFQPEEAFTFLQLASRLLRGGGMLIGVDLVKDPARLHAAYNDAQGVTAAFNLNLLRRANNELGADFDLDAFDHHALYNPVLHRIEMHLISRRRQSVRLFDEKYVLDEGETIHTENSYKYTVESFRKLAMKAGFEPGSVWLDSERLFSVHWLKAPAA